MASKEPQLMPIPTQPISNEQYTQLWDAVDTEETNPWSHPEKWSDPEATKFRFMTTVAMWKDAMEGAGI